MRDPDLLALAAKVRYEVDPANEYPRNYTGDVRVVLRDGSVREAHQPYLRGGVREPLGHAEIARKFRANAAFGGWPDSRTLALETSCNDAYGRSDLAGLAAFRHG